MNLQADYFLQHHTTTKIASNIASFMININNTDNQLAATITDLLIPISSTCFRRWLRPPSGASDCAYSLWYITPSLLPPAGNSVGVIYHKL